MVVPDASDNKAISPPGWYPDPWSPSQQRYWDGDWTAWTASVERSNDKAARNKRFPSISASFVIISVVLLTIGWIVGMSLPERLADNCGQPENLPSGDTTALALYAMLSALGGVVAAIVRAVRGGAKGRVVAVLIVGSLLALVGGAAEFLWTQPSQICF